MTTKSAQRAAESTPARGRVVVRPDMAAPAIALCVAVLIAGLRLRVAPWYDLGFLIDDYARLGAGLHPHLDYGTSIPQLATMLAWLIAPRSVDPLFYFNILDIGLWLINTALLVAFARRLRLDNGFLAACLLLWVAAAGPSAIPHLYDQLGTALLVLTALSALSYHDRGGALRAAGLGLLVATTAFAKPSIGLAAAGIAAAAFIARHLAGAIAPALRDAVAGALGGALGTAGALALLMRGEVSVLFNTAAVTEVLRQIFLDAGTAKGGALTLLRWIPRLKSGVLSGSLAYQAAGSVAAYALASAVLVRLSRSAPPASTTAIPEREWGAIALALVFGPCSVLAGTIVSPFMASFDDIIVGRTLNNLFYLVVLAGAGTFIGLCLRRGNGFSRPHIVGDHRRMIHVVAMVAALFAIGTSSIDYPPYTGPVLIPALAVTLMTLIGRRKALAVLIGIASIYMIVGLTFDSYRSNGFRTGCALPKPGGDASALTGATEQCARYQAVATHIVPAVAGTRVAWLTMPSGFAAFAGTPAAGLGDTYWDAYSPRIESRVRALWERQPPDTIVIEHGLRLPPGSALAPGGSLRTWIAAHYRETVTAYGDRYVVMRRR